MNDTQYIWIFNTGIRGFQGTSHVLIQRADGGLYVHSQHIQRLELLGSAQGILYIFCYFPGPGLIECRYLQMCG
jgi:hypothetical protein